MHYSFLLALLGCLTVLPVLAESAEKSESTEIVKVKGYADGENFTLEIIPGEAATHAIRIYSEPSHTLLALIEDSKFAESDLGKTWRNQVVAEGQPRAGSLTSLPEGRARLFMEARDASDDRIATWVYGTWPDGTVEDRLVGDGKVGNGPFEFSIAVGQSSTFGPGRE